MRLYNFKSKVTLYFLYKAGEGQAGPVPATVTMQFSDESDH